MSELLALRLRLTPPQADAPAEVIANVEIRSAALGLTPEKIPLNEQVTEKEREELHRYLEEYWKWPFEGFQEHGEKVEKLLEEVGKRLYKAVFASTGEAAQIMQAWRLLPAQARQISIVSEAPRALNLPWELLHDQQGFLVLRPGQPISIVRSQPQGELPMRSSTFVPPLRILLVTAHPEGTGFIDPRSVARELLEAMQDQIEAGAIDVEFLRPPTIEALQKRLRNTQRPASTTFNWKAPVPRAFTRATDPTFWPGDRRYRPMDLTFRRLRDLKAITQAMPSELTPILRQRFKPPHSDLHWETPSTPSTMFRQGFEECELHDLSESLVCAKITVTANLIERLVNAPESGFGGLTHNYLLYIQTLRLRQLWEEVQRRPWPEPPLVIFVCALG